MISEKKTQKFLNISCIRNRAYINIIKAMAINQPVHSSVTRKD
jgi:hypothetical protein